MVNAPELSEYAFWFRQSSPYINALRKKVVVLNISGESMDDENLPNIIHDISLLNSLGVRLVLVHGARPQIDRRLNELNVESKFHRHWRLTDDKQLPALIEAVGSVRSKIEALLSMGVANTPMQNSRIRVVSGNFVTAKPRGVIEGVDYGHCGEVRKVDKAGIKAQLEQGNIVLISCLGYSPTGEIFNLNTEDLATEVACSLQVEKLIFLNGREGVLAQDESLINEIPLAELAAVLDYLPEDSETARQLIAAKKALLKGINRCHIVSYHHDGALLGELFTREGRGTMIIQDSYEQMRPAQVSDLGGLLELLEPLENDGILVRRSRELLENEIDSFVVIDLDGMIIGCAALYQFEHSAELACIAVHPDYREGDRGQRLLDELEKRAKSLEIDQVFVLTTRTAHWFKERGFKDAEISQLPDSRQELYNFQRNSKVYIKQV